MLRFFPIKDQYIIFMAWRQVSSRKKKSLSFMTTISIFGITIGVAALVVVLSVMGGLGDDIKDKTFHGLPHLEILAQTKAAGFSLKDLSVEKVRHIYPKAKYVEPFVQSHVLIKKGKTLRTLNLFGINPVDGAKLWGFSRGMVEGEIQHLLSPNIPLDEDQKVLPGIVLGSSLASALSAQIGDEVLVLNPGIHAINVLSQGHFSLPFRVVGIFMTDLPNYDEKYGVVTLNDARQFMADYDPSLDEEEYVTGIGVSFEDPEEIDLFPMFDESLKGMDIATWKTVNKALLFALKLEKFTMGAILLLIVLVAAFSISGTMMMTVHYKKRSISILRSLGMSQGQCARLFILHGLGIATIGISFGLIIGFCLLGFLKVMEIYNLDLPPIFVDKPPPFAFLPMEYAVICVSSLLLSLLAAAYPALVAAKQDPGSGLRAL